MASNRFTCVLMGDGSLLTQCGNLLLERGHQVAAVVTAQDDIAQWAAEHGIKRLNSEEVIQNGLPQTVADWFFSIANLRLLPNSVWQAAQKGAANFHDGPLPRHAGLNAPAWAILAGDTYYGVTWHALSEEVDKGDIYVQRIFEIAADETSLTLNIKCFEEGLASFGQMVDCIEQNTLAGKPQNPLDRSYHSRYARPTAGATLNFTDTTEDSVRLARAMTFGERYLNPLCTLKLRTAIGAYNVLSLDAASNPTSAPPGRVISVEGSSACIATADGAVRVSSITDETGSALEICSILRSGDQLPLLSVSETERLNTLIKATARHESFFQARLENFRDFEFYGLTTPQEAAIPRWKKMELELPAVLNGSKAIAALIAGLARLGGVERVDAFFVDEANNHQAHGYIADTVPLSITIEEDTTPATLSATVAAEMSELRRKIGYAADLANRIPRLGRLRSTLAIKLCSDLASAGPRLTSALTFVIPSSNEHKAYAYVDLNCLPAAEARKMLDRLEIAIQGFSLQPHDLIANLPLMSKAELTDLLHSRNNTQTDYDRSALIHTLIEKQAEFSPDALAIICGDESLTYREVNTRAARVAEYLTSLGVSRGSLVGLNLRRSSDLVVGALAIMKAGGAYVPLDPNYPTERIEYMIADSGLKVLIVDAPAAHASATSCVRATSIPEALAAVPVAGSVATVVAPDDVAYVIYTSGSTGRPKGVMVEHRNVVNFFVGMNERVQRPASTQAVWLAVTSLSFDISVLELFWTLARGFKVIVHADQHGSAHSGSTPRPATRSGMDFGLFYWGDDDAPGENKYQLLLDGARFADKHGFTAVWTPERHFHAFGGPYPNPAVTGAAVAAITQNVSIRAGSCVLPLHHPARVAEEWAVIDNISQGRVALAFASGWMPEDFILRPENAPPANKEAMFRDVEIVRKLWRGERVSFPAADGKSVDITTLPRPVQSELPVWITTAGNPDTFRTAARHGANILTHLLGQSIDDVAGKVSAYRDELRTQGLDPSRYKVTLMLHTLIGHDREVVRDLAREPMKRYLKSAAALIKEYAWAFPAFKRPSGIQRPIDLDLRTLDEDEMDAIVEFAFHRYFDESGLFGTVDDARARVAQLSAIGVDEIACLIDFGVSREVALHALTPLAELVAQMQPPHLTSQPFASVAGESIGALIRRHRVTHLQCTPAMATMLLESEEDRTALGDIRHLFIGGEALQGSLLKRLRQFTQATVENMYGPTETTIWSSTGPAHETDGTVPLGTPIANTQLYVLDAKLRPAPRGIPGELFIGGDGVARGYHNRPDLTSERFLANPFITGQRIYRTGDLVRIDDDGTLHFIGRSDHQVKVRGYRIELGEIENCIALHPAVAQTVVIVREDTAGDVRIVAYLRFKNEQLSDEELRQHIRQSLPDFMVPAHYVRLAQFPLTPNLKVDRKALPKPGKVSTAVEAAVYQAPASSIEKQIVDIFQRVLGLERMGINDNFFHLGGHSLLAVQAHRDLKALVTQKLLITDLYRFPTVAGLVAHLTNSEGASKHLDKIAARATERRASLAARRVAIARPEQ